MVRGPLSTVVSSWKPVSPQTRLETIAPSSVGNAVDVDPRADRHAAGEPQRGRVAEVYVVVGTVEVHGAAVPCRPPKSARSRACRRGRAPDASLALVPDPSSKAYPATKVPGVTVLETVTVTAVEVATLPAVSLARATSECGPLLTVVVDQEIE